MQALLSDEEIRRVVKEQREEDKTTYGIDNIFEVHEFSDANSAIRSIT
jgi:hypothetical protein